MLKRTWKEKEGGLGGGAIERDCVKRGNRIGQGKGTSGGWRGEKANFLGEERESLSLLY